VVVRTIGLTGGVGSGKSTVAEMLRELGATVIDADEGARAVVEPGTPGLERVAAEFGSSFVKEGRLDRARLGDLVFRDPDARLRLNAIVHPLVREWVAGRMREAEAAGARLVVQDVPLLFENGLEGLFEATVLVYARPEQQLERLVQWRGFGEERAQAMIAAQQPLDEKRKRAGHVIDNSGSREATRRQVDQLWRELARR